MDKWQSAVTLTTTLVGLGALAGMSVRSRLRRVRFFTLYVTLVSAYGLLVLLRPELVVWRAWLIKELLLSLVALLTALEVGVQLFAARAGARPYAGRAVLVVMAVTVLFLGVRGAGPDVSAALSTSSSELWAFQQALGLLPRLAYGSAWLFAALWVAAQRFEIPVDPLREAVLLGFAVFWLLQAVSLGLLSEPQHARLTSDVLTLAFLAVLLIWAWFAWRSEIPPSAPPEIVARVWPDWRG